MAEDNEPVDTLGTVRAVTLGILHDRTQRRKFVIQLIILLLSMVIIGHWPLSAWLADGLLRFIIWWGFVAFLTVWILLFAIYDALRVVREERDKVLGELSDEGD